MNLKQLSFAIVFGAALASVAQADQNDHSKDKNKDAPVPHSTQAQRADTQRYTAPRYSASQTPRSFGSNHSSTPWFNSRQSAQPAYSGRQSTTPSYTRQSTQPSFGSRTYGQSTYSRQSTPPVYGSRAQGQGGQGSTSWASDPNGYSRNGGATYGSRTYGQNPVNTHSGFGSRGTAGGSTYGSTYGRTTQTGPSTSYGNQTSTDWTHRHQGAGSAGYGLGSGTHTSVGATHGASGGRTGFGTSTGGFGRQGNGYGSGTGSSNRYGRGTGGGTGWNTQSSGNNHQGQGNGYGNGSGSYGRGNGQRVIQRGDTSRYGDYRPQYGISFNFTNNAEQLNRNVWWENEHHQARVQDWNWHRDGDQWRYGYYQDPGFSASNFYFGSYLFTPYQDNCVVSPWYYYPTLPAYLPENIVVVTGGQVNWIAGSPYNYNSYSTYNNGYSSYSSPELDDAISGINSIFSQDNQQAIVDLIPQDEEVGIYNEGQYMYSINGADFEKMMADNAENTQTTSFRILSVRRSGDQAIVTTQHTFDDPQNGTDTVYQRYQLRNEGGRYVISAFMTSHTPFSSYSRF